MPTKLITFEDFLTYFPDRPRLKIRGGWGRKDVKGQSWAKYKKLGI